jgi:hypothetical protein
MKKNKSNPFCLILETRKVENNSTAFIAFIECSRVKCNIVTISIFNFSYDFLQSLRK